MRSNRSIHYIGQRIEQHTRRKGSLQGGGRLKRRRSLLNFTNGTDRTGQQLQKVRVSALQFSEMGNRNVHQCRQKWVLSLDPSLKKGVFSRSEDLRLYAYAFFDHTPNWPAIAKTIPGRTAKQCRERCAYLKKHSSY